MGFLTDDDLMTAIAAAMHKAPDALAADSPFWWPLATWANTRAYNQMVRVLASRGYTPAQIAAWDEGADLQRDLGTFWALSRAGVNATGLDKETMKTFDRREELATIQVTNGQVFQAPLGAATAFGVGSYDAGSDMFGTPEDPDDPRIGRPMRF